MNKQEIQRIKGKAYIFACEAAYWLQLAESTLSVLYSTNEVKNGNIANSKATIPNIEKLERFLMLVSGSNIAFEAHKNKGAKEAVLVRLKGAIRFIINIKQDDKEDSVIEQYGRVLENFIKTANEIMDQNDIIPPPPPTIKSLPKHHPLFIEVYREVSFLLRMTGINFYKVETVTADYILSLIKQIKMQLIWIKPKKIPLPPEDSDLEYLAPKLTRYLLDLLMMCSMVLSFDCLTEEQQDSYRKRLCIIKSHLAAIITPADSVRKQIAVQTISRIKNDSKVPTL